jgi:type II secretory pathway pseudopilin PulG
MRCVTRRTGFTIVEILVVATIIVLLLALLAPALDRAVYQAELAMCAANQRAIAHVALIYAGEHRRAYPHRPGVHGSAQWRPPLLYDTLFDDRPLLQSYMNVNETLSDPLSTKMDLEGSDADSWVFANYDLWFGWQYRGETAAYQGMFRLGDRFAYDNLAGVWAFPLLAGDINTTDLGRTDSNTVFGNHPDFHKMIPQSWQNGQAFSATDNAAGASVGAAPLSGKWTYSWWISWGDPRRAQIDLNFAFDDGGVHRYAQVSWREGQEHRRLTLAKVYRDPEFLRRWWTFLPAR